MSTIDFVVRDSAGDFQRGTLVTEAGRANVRLAPGADISLNLYSGQVSGYQQNGQALNVVLANGEVLVIENFFAMDGTASELFVSAGGELSKVNLVPGEGGTFYASYDDAGDFGKWTPLDDFFFLRGPDILVADTAVAGDDDVGMLANPVLGALGGGLPLGVLGLGVGGAVLADQFTRGESSDSDSKGVNGDEDDRPEEDDDTTGGDDNDTTGGDDNDTTGGDDNDTTGGDDNDTTGGDDNDTTGGDDNDTTDDDDDDDGDDGENPTVDFTSGVESTGDIVNYDDFQDGVTITGTGTIGCQVAVEINGVIETTTVGTDGTWTVTFDGSDVGSGEHITGCTVIITDDEGRTGTNADNVVVDTVTYVTFDEDIVETDGVANAVEVSDGVQLSGSVEANSTVVVTVSGKNYTATVTGTTWTCTIPAADVTGGEYTMDVSVSSTDSVGNTASTSGTVEIDTTTFVTISTSTVEGDGVVSYAEWQDGVPIGGTAEAGARVTLTVSGRDYTTTASASGTWSVNVSRSDIPEGTYELDVSAKSTDRAGNSASTTGKVDIDTETMVEFSSTPVETDGIVNNAERADGVTLTGITEPGASVTVTLNGRSQLATVDATGNWTVDFAASALPAGNVEGSVVATATATDIYGNTATTAMNVGVDTWVNQLAFTNHAGGADQIVNASEAAAKITLTGVVEKGSSVLVEVEGFSGQATVATNGNWTIDIPAGTFPAGEDFSSVKLTATDAAGNTRTATQTVEVDTIAPEIPMVTAFERGKVEGIRQISIAENEPGLTVHEIEADGSSHRLAMNTYYDGANNEYDLRFADNVPDGSQLVITSSDAAGNSNATLFVLDEAGSDSVNIGLSGMSQFNIGSIDLDLAFDSELTITAADLAALSKNDNSLTIHGGADDTVTMTGAIATGETRMIGGRSYDVYSLGDDGSVIIDDDVSVVI
ncbi:Ig-like domain-containing protein [Pelagovum pacificum]|uniref:Ig-like domain-containing protein n=1 Tax=Pelagovum pacificum TaxID=2588711 RepID=A0A5C5G9A6_9RHOB|nr:Ig-like domain-containing protein [Pelagovum pacificum]QQA41862.1 Ig-like domain-containing protein [Pelagovum pacificum]TNY30695.1 Ig-like domain-containing protein [Pelagovum pacificum]